MKITKEEYIWAFLRIGLGWIFLWAFIDKLLGLGFSTKIGKGWILGNSPTLGFLKFATHGPFAVFYQGIAGNPIVDWLFMLGLLFVGTGLILGIGVKLASYGGALMLILMWTAVLPPKNNPIIDEHIIYILILIGLSFGKPGRLIGLGKWWSKTHLIKKYKILE